MLRYNLYLNDILRATSAIEESMKNKDIEQFEGDRNLVDATAMRLQIIGESISKLPSRFKINKNVGWEDLRELRNIISHAYFRINPKILFDVIQNQIPELKREIQKIKGEVK